MAYQPLTCPYRDGRWRIESRPMPKFQGPSVPHTPFHNDSTPQGVIERAMTSKTIASLQP